MNKTYRNLLYIALSTLLCLFLALPSSAQRSTTSSSSGGGGGGSHPSGGGSSGGGGGGSRPSGGGSSASVRSSGGGGGVSSSRPSSNIGISRPGSGMVPQRPQGAVAVRGNYGYAPRPGVAVNGNYTPRQGGAIRGNLGYTPRPGVAVNGNFGNASRLGVAPRGVTGAGSGYRTAPQIGYGIRGGYWGNHGYYHYNHGYYHTGYFPRIGFSCGFLPYGYYPFYWGDNQYFFSDGLFYEYDNSQYTVVEPPIGAEIKTLPDKAQSIVINGQQYYELNGVYYQPVTKDDGTVVYMVAGKDGELNTGGNVQGAQPQGPQMGDIVTQLPQDCRKIKVNGSKLWVSPDGVYYQEQVDANGVKTYKIVGLPSDEPEQN